jgi:glutathione synthase/RimK-type ligase-like ATP-grasp enzyme
MKQHCELSIYLEESYFLDFDNHNFEENIFFVKGKGDLILSLVKLIERESNIPIINSSKAIIVAFNRFMNSTLLRKAGIRVPDFSLSPKDQDSPFESYIIKNIRDQDNYAFNPEIQHINSKFIIRDKRALDETFGKNAQYSFLYYQKFIDSEYEYKIYGVGDDLFYYKQLPILIEQDKMKNRIEIKPISELGEITYNVMDLFDLKITSMDFLKSHGGEYFLTDVNSTPNFNYIKNGIAIVGDYLLSQAKK